MPVCVCVCVCVCVRLRCVYRKFWKCVTLRQEDAAAGMRLRAGQWETGMWGPGTPGTPGVEPDGESDGRVDLLLSVPVLQCPRSDEDPTRDVSTSHTHTCALLLSAVAMV